MGGQWEVMWGLWGSWEVSGGSWEVSESSWEVSGRLKGGHNRPPGGCWRWQGRNSRLESSSDGEIFDKEKKEEDVKTEEEEKDQAVKNKEENVKEKLIKMKAAAKEAQDRAEKADS